MKAWEVCVCPRSSNAMQCHRSTTSGGNRLPSAMGTLWARQHIVAAVLLSAVLARSGVNATYFNVGSNWSIKNDDTLDVQRNGEALRTIFMDFDTSSFALAFYDINGTSLSAVDSFVLAIVAMPLRSSGVWNVVWSANRERPVGQNAVLGFKADGNLALWDANAAEVWSTNAPAGVRITTVSMDKSGNLVLLDAAFSSVWQSFDHPTDTILPGQVLRVGSSLVSNASGDPLLHPYQLAVEDGGLALYASYASTSNTVQKVPYWVSSLGPTQDLKGVLTTCQHPALVLLDDTQGLVVAFDHSLTLTAPFNSTLCSRTYLEATTLLSNYGLDVSQQFVRLDADGNIRLYVFGVASQAWDVVASVLTAPCDAPNACGQFGICSRGRCNCSNYAFSDEASKLADTVDVAVGCKAPGGARATTGSINCGSPSAEMITLPGVDYFSNNVLTLQRVPQLGYTALFKVFNPAATHSPPPPEAQLDSAKVGVSPIVIGLSVGLGSVGIILVLLFGIWILFRLWGKKRKRVQIQKAHHEEPGEEDEFLDSSLPGLPSRYTLKDLSIATNGFQTRLGGSVYEGSLPDGTRVAVKRLEAAAFKQTQVEEFRAEVATISSIHHSNLVRLTGFCFEGVHRMLVYEFIAKGSLDKWLFAPKEGAEEFKTDGFVLDWNTRFKIALGTARGLGHLHEECSSRIIHMDVKPQNILLDDQFFPKVTDFGLSKLVFMNQQKEDENENNEGGALTITASTSVRGTPGYLAPELLLGSHVSDKIDIYSYGIVLIELLTGRKSIDLFMEFDSDYFPSWAMNMARDGRLREALDKRLGDLVPEVQCQRVIQIAYWCVHRDFKRRPAMRMVVRMLEGLAVVPDMPEAEPADLSSFKMPTGRLSSEFL